MAQETKRPYRRSKPCPRCNESHHHLSYCKDGERLVKTAPPFAKGNQMGRLRRKKAPEPGAEAQAVSPEPEPPVTVIDTAPVVEAVPDRHADIKAIIASLPEGSSQRKALENMLERDTVRTRHAADEADLQARTGNPDAKLPIPTILRDKSEDKGLALNRELDRFLYSQGVNPNVRETSRKEVMDNLAPEARSVHDTLASTLANREMTERARQMAASKPEHVPGDTDWFCNGCKKGFTSGSLDMVRRKAAAEREWRFLCPHCMDPRVQLREGMSV